MNNTFQLFVAEPEVNPSSLETCPVLYLLDANSTFMMATEMVRMLHWTNELPPLLIVGIGYEEGDITTIANRRMQELTPTADPEYKKIFRSRFSFDAIGGEARSFLNFLREELKPFIESCYGIHGQVNILAGTSLGGLFALYSLFHEPDTFSHYIIGSPSIFWDNGILWQYEERFFKHRQQLDAKVFLGAGSREDTEPYHFPEDCRDQMAHIKLVDDTKRMVRRLGERKYQGLELHSHIFDGETHMSVIAPLLNRGLRTLLHRLVFVE